MNKEKRPRVSRSTSRARRTERKSEDHQASLITILDPTNRASEAYRTLRTNLLYAFVDDPPTVIVLTSSGQGEGKSTICANLGVVLAQAGKRTLIIDGDFRKPMLHAFFGLRNIRGLTEVLARMYSLQEVWSEPLTGLKVVPVGSIPPNPTELLSSQRLSELLASVREEFDYVLIDAPPVLLVSDAAIMAKQGDGVLLVLDAQKTRKWALQESIRNLEAIGANVLGTVVNNVNASRDDSYYRGYEQYS
jgi:capsular exopolysaccharide synthesis family protein